MLVGVIEGVLVGVFVTDGVGVGDNPKVGVALGVILGVGVIQVEEHNAPFTIVPVPDTEPSLAPIQVM